MIKHIVMWSLKDEYNGMNKKEIAKELKEQLLNLKGKIEEIVSIEVGINAINEDKNHDVVLITEFQTFDDLKKYSVHPEHVKVVEFVKNIVIARGAVDFTVES